MAEAAGGAGSIDLVGLLKAGQAFGSTIADSLAELNIATGTITAAGATAKAAIKEKADSDIEAARLQAEKKLAAEAKAQNVMAMFGTNTEASDSTVRMLAARINQDSEEIRNSKLAINQKLSVGPTDDLIGWISNQFTLPTDAAIHNNKVAARDADSQRLKDLQAATREQIAINAAADSGTSMAIAAATAKGTAAKAAADAAGMDFETARAGVSILGVRMTANSQQLQMSFNLFQAKNQQEQLQLARSADSRAQQSLELQKELHSFTKAARQDEENGKKLFTDRYNTVRASLNLPPSSWVEFKNLPKAQQDSWDKLMNNPDLVEGRLGASPAEAYALAKGLGIQLPGAAGATATAIDDARKLMVGKNEQTWKGLSPEVQLQLVNKQFNDKLKQDSVNIPEKGSLLTIGSLSSVAKIKSLNDGVGGFFMEELKPLMKDPEYATKPADFLATGMKLIREGKVDVATAASQIAITFKAATQDNYEVKQLKRFSVPGKLAEHYNVVMDLGSFRSATTVDMTNSMSVQNALIRMMNNKDDAGTFNFSQTQRLGK